MLQPQKRFLQMNKKRHFLMLSFIPVVLLLLFFLTKGQGNAATTLPPCRTLTMTTSLSPDKLWKARVINYECDSDYSWFVENVYRVEITSVSNLSKTEWVYQNDVEPDHSFIPIISWSGTHALNISAKTLKKGLFKVKSSSFSDVPIRITYR